MVRRGSVSRCPGWNQDRVISYLNHFHQVGLEDLPIYSDTIKAQIDKAASEMDGSDSEYSVTDLIPDTE